MWSKIKTPCHQASHKGLALSCHGDNRHNGHNGVAELRASTGQVAVLQFLAALCCVRSEGVTVDLKEKQC